VLRTARLLMRDDAAAEDLAQETLLRAFRAIDQFKSGTDARAWLLTILRNARVDWIRSRAKESRDVSLERLGAEPEEPDESSAEPNWDDPAQMLEAFSDDRIIDALQELPEEIRWTLLLVDVEQMDHRDASVILDVPVGTVKSRTHRGRAMLRRMLSPVAREIR
jgi:RNA polymerase sigma-70 factor (ECF subfamily)